MKRCSTSYVIGKCKLKQQRDTIKHLLEWPQFEHWQHQMLARRWSKGNSPSLLVGMQNCTITLEDSLVAAHKTEYALTVQSRHCAPWYLPRGVENLRSHKNLYVDDYTSFPHNSQNVEATKISFSRGMNKLWHIHTMGYCSALKGNKLSRNEKIQWNLKCLFLSERSQSGRLHTVWFPLSGILEDVKLWRQ